MKSGKLNRSIIVIGIPRSGVRLIGDIIGFSGIKSAEKELAPIVDKIIVDLGGDIKAQERLPDSNLAGLVSSETCKTIAHIIDVRRKSDDWVFVCYRAALIWPILIRAFPSAVWVVVRRDIKDVVNSCLKTTYMSRKNTVADWNALAAHYVECFIALMAKSNDGLKLFSIWPSKIMNKDFMEVYHLLNYLGMDIPRLDEKIIERIWGGGGR